MIDFSKGWKRDDHDDRDIIYKITAPIQVPDVFSLRNTLPDGGNQLDLGSCVTWAVEILFRKLKKTKTIYSHLFLYYNTRLLEGTPPTEDSGCQIRNAIKSIAKTGICRESLCKYVINRFSKKPSNSAYKDALKNKAVRYERLPQDLQSLKQALYEGFPIAFGFDVYQNIRECYFKPFILPMPEGQLLGGHAVTITGYNDATQLFEVRNSWGKEWGDGDYFYMPYKYVLDNNLSSDFWVIKQVQ